MTFVARLASNYLGFPQPFSSLISTSRTKTSAATKSTAFYSSSSTSGAPLAPPLSSNASWFADASMSTRPPPKRFSLGSSLGITRRASAPLLSQEVRELINDDEAWSTDDDDIFPQRPRLSLSAHHRTYSEPVTSLTRAVTQSNFLRKTAVAPSASKPPAPPLAPAPAPPTPTTTTPVAPVRTAITKSTIPAASSPLASNTAANPTRPRPFAPQRSKTLPLRPSPRLTASSSLPEPTPATLERPPIPLIVVTHSPASPPTLASPTASDSNTSFTPLQDSRFNTRLTVPGHPAVNSTFPPLSAGGCYFPEGRYDDKLGHWLTVLPGIDVQNRNGWRSEPTGIRDEIWMGRAPKRAIVDLTESSSRASISSDDGESFTSFGLTQQCTSPDSTESADSPLWANQENNANNNKSTPDTTPSSFSSSLPRTPSSPPTPPPPALSASTSSLPSSSSISISASKILAAELSRRRHDSCGRRRPAAARRSDSFVTALKQREQSLASQQIQLHLPPQQKQSSSSFSSTNTTTIVLSASLPAPPRRQSSEERRYAQQLVQQQQQHSQARPISPTRIARRSTLSYSVHIPPTFQAQQDAAAPSPRTRHVSASASPIPRPVWQECDITESLLVSRLVPALSS